jgi:DNA-directed RNA polymerase subunit RPC12/RpoP
VRIVLLIIVAVLVLGVIMFLRRQSKARTRWGIGNLVGKCPRCGTTMPAIRTPSSLQEGLWGGWTCPNCGAKVDKYGRERV